jgi:hypothetical protein
MSKTSEKNMKNKINAKGLALLNIEMHEKSLIS